MEVTPPKTNVTCTCEMKLSQEGILHLPTMVFQVRTIRFRDIVFEGTYSHLVTTLTTSSSAIAKYNIMSPTLVESICNPH